MLTRKLYTLANKYIDSYNNHSYDISTNGEMAILCKLRELKNFGHVYFDVGFNKGEWTKSVLTNFSLAEVHAFEINKRAFEPFKKNTQIVCNEFGLSDQNETITFKDYGKDNPHNSPILDFEWVDFKVPHVIKTQRVMRGDKYCKDIGIEFIDFLKVDVEGYEYKVLNGFEHFLEFKLIRVVQFEYGYVNSITKNMMSDFYKFFEQYGYIIGKLNRQNVNFKSFSFPMNDFKSGPNYIAIRNDDDTLKQLLT